MKKPETYIKEIDKLVRELVCNYSPKEINEGFIKYGKPTHYATGSLYDEDIDENDEEDGE